MDYLVETKTYTVEMEFRQGLTFSHMLVGRSLTRGRLLTLLTGLHKIHTTATQDPLSSPAQNQLQISSALAEKFKEHSVERTGEPNLYANYGTKLRSRYFAFKERYDGLGSTAANYFERLNEFLDTYEAEEKGVRMAIIHGDPVFSNVILSPDESRASFIDVRCQLSSTLTMEGDLHYDLAKVLQSLMGYDHILLTPLDQLPKGEEKLLEDADERVLENLREVFWEWVEGTYGLGVHRKTLLRITASLMFSLIPLHKEELGPVFLRLCGKTLALASGSGTGYQGMGMRISAGVRKISERLMSEEVARSVSSSGKYLAEASWMSIKEKVGLETGLKAVDGNRVKLLNLEIEKGKGKEVEVEDEAETRSPAVVVSDMMFSTIV